MAFNFNFKAVATVACLSFFSLLPASAQKKALDHDAYDSWQSVSGTKLTTDGKFLSYIVNPQEGDGELFIVNLQTNQKVRIERGSDARLSQDGKWAVCSVKPTFAQSRAQKIAKKKDTDNAPKDTLVYVNLATMAVTKVPGATSIKTARNNISQIIYNSQDKKGSKLVILDPATGHADTLKNVDRSALSTNGTRLAIVTKKDKADSLSKDGVAIYKLPSMEVMDFTPSLAGKKKFTVPTFNEDGTMAWFMATSDTLASGSKNEAIYLFKETLPTKKIKASWNVTEVLPQGYTDGLPKGYAVTDQSSARFNYSNSRLIVNVSPVKAPKDTTIVESEQASLDIWNYDALRLPPQQKVSRGARTLTAVIDLANTGKMTLITKTPEERLTLIQGGDSDMAIVTDNTKYAISSTWDNNSFSDIWFVNLKDGSRKVFAEKFNVGYSFRQSPTGRYLMWFSPEDLGWHTYDIQTGADNNITAAAGVNFFDEENDTPSVPGSYGSPVWLENDEAVIVPDRYDLWKITPDGKKVQNLTKGVGRASNVQFRYTDFVDDPDGAAMRNAGITKGLARKSRIWLTAFNEKDKRNGLGTVSIAAPEDPVFFLDTFSFTSPVKAKNADVIAFKKGNFRMSPDQYITRDAFKTDVKLSAINPQQSDYVWGNVQLVDWKAYDGTPLQGLLFTPDNLDKSKKYPMMIYFYEKYSETLYDYRSPAPSRSTVNIPFFTSRGYVVFIPDIVYVDGHPGECAYNCICAGAEAMCEQFSFIDKSKMAIQGQSWGGYQTAYLVTRTDMFAAAGAGAPVGNMTSAYGGIRWESGNSRAVQYEHGQSRIGKGLWDEGGLELYIENSPVFHANKVKTPTLIMHNDADGAVPWYQGIEFFMALRHFGVPSWMLEYNDEAHNLGQRKNAKDLSVRLSQFFDHYLKGEPMPAWMKYGVPTERKADFYYGFEYAE